ncbi:MAG: hypothetical protein ACOYT8_01910 [Candidatus Dependentiae bacterium]
MKIASLILMLVTSISLHGNLPHSVSLFIIPSEKKNTFEAELTEHQNKKIQKGIDVCVWGGVSLIAALTTCHSWDNLLAHAQQGQLAVIDVATLAALGAATYQLGSFTHKKYKQ